MRARRGGVRGGVSQLQVLISSRVRGERLFAAFSRAKEPLEAEIKKEAELIGSATRERQTRYPKDAGGLSARSLRGLLGLYAKMLEPDYHKL